MDRIPLRAGTSTPEFVDKTLAVFGNNPHGEPNFRLIWSERKQIWFAGDVYPEYEYLPQPCWVLETWTPPEKDAGSEVAWSQMQEAFMGPYPRKGTFNYVKHYPEDWAPTVEHVRLVAKGIEESRNFGREEREAAIRAGLEEKSAAARKLVADEITESFGSAELGKVTQPASGRGNVFRTADDFGRDREKEIAGLPKRGGKLVN